MRIAIVGICGAGKSTLAARVAERLGAPHVELDAHYHQADWRPASDEAFRASVASATAGARWVVDGNYRGARDLVWPRADRVVWLDFERGLATRRVLLRSFARAWDRAELWNGNRERWRHWLDPDHPIRYGWRVWAARRDEYAALADTRWIRLGGPVEQERWVATLPAAGPDRSGLCSVGTAVSTLRLAAEPSSATVAP